MANPNALFTAESRTSILNDLRGSVEAGGITWEEDDVARIITEAVASYFYNHQNWVLLQYMNILPDFSPGIWLDGWAQFPGLVRRASESDDVFRTRIFNWFHSLEPAGSEASILYHAKQIDGVSDVSYTVSGNAVSVYLIATREHAANRMPSTTLNNAVQATLRLPNVAAITDTYTVYPPTINTYTLNVDLDFDSNRFTQTEIESQLGDADNGIMSEVLDSYVLLGKEIHISHVQADLIRENENLEGITLTPTPASLTPSDKTEAFRCIGVTYV